MALLFQYAFYIGNTFNGILYGVELILCFLTVEAMSRKSRAHRVRSDFLFMAFSGTALLLNTVYVATEAVFGQEMWITNANYTGGQNAYLADHASVWYQTLGTSASIVLNLLSDALLIYRCYVIWGHLRVIVAPCALYLATLCLGIAQLVASGSPHGDYFSGVAHKLGISYTTTVMALEVIVTALICARILQVGRWYRTTTAPTSSERRARAVRSYTGAVTIIAESALPCTFVGLAYLVTFAIHNDLSILFLSLYVMFSCISPQLIILRVMSGRAWTRQTTESIMSGGPVDYPDTLGILSSAFSVGSDGASSHLCKECEGRYLQTQLGARSV